LDSVDVEAMHNEYELTWMDSVDVEAMSPTQVSRWTMRGTDLWKYELKRQCGDSRVFMLRYSTVTVLRRPANRPDAQLLESATVV